MAGETIFLSYSRVDRDAARKLYHDLERAGFKLWRDIHDIPAGEDWWRQIKDAIEGCDTLLLCMSLPALRSPVVSEEWSYARQLGRRIVPVVVDEVFKHPDVLAGHFTIPGWMQRANWLDLRPGTPERKAAWENLLITLRRPYEPRPVHITVHAAQLPHNFVPRREEFEPLVSALVKSEGDPVAITAALRGAGGYGKTTLAKALCRDLRVSGAFDEGVYWVTLGEGLLDRRAEALESELVTRLLDLVYEITRVRPPVAKLDAAQEELARALADRHALLVVDDVWRAAHLKPFLVKGKHNATLITTRDDGTLPREAQRFTVDAMGTSDALDLLAAGFDEAERQAHKSALTGLAERLGRWPLLLGIVNGALHDWSGRLRSFAAAIKRANDLLTRKGLTAFDPHDPLERTEAVRSTLDASIEHLQTEEQQRYESLGIFPPDEAIPVAHAAVVWELDEIDAGELCLEWIKASLLQDYDGKMLRLHNVVRAYLEKRLADPAPLHRKLLDAWGDLVATGYQLPDDYAWRWYVYHHIKAGWEASLLLLGYRWLQAKLDATDVSALLADFDQAGREDTLRLIQSALSLSAHVLAQDKGQLPMQIAGRLYLHREKPGIATLLAAIQTGAFKPLNPPVLNQAGGALRRTLEGHASGLLGGVNDVLALPDGRLLSWGRDGMLRLWSGQGETLAVLEGHTGGVNGALALLDGRLLSWSNDGTLRLWSSQGEALDVLVGHEDEVLGVLALPDRRLLSWSRDDTLRLWSYQGETLAVLKGHGSWVNGALALPDGRLLSWSSDRTLRLWSSQGEALAILKGHTGGVSGALALMDGRLLSWGSGGILRLWNSQGEVLTILEERADEVLGGVNGVLELPDGRLLSWGADDTLRLWSSQGEALIALEGHFDWVLGALALPDGRLLSWSNDGTLRLWSGGGQSLAILEGHTDRVNGALALMDGRLLSWSRDGTLRLWSSQGEQLAVLEGHTSWVNGALILPGGQLLSWSSDGTLRLWNSNEEVLTTLKGHIGGVSGVLTLKDGRALSWGRDGALQLWSNQGESSAILRGHTDWVLGALALSDGRLLSWCRDGTLRLWSSSGEAQTVLKGHTSRVNGVLVLADGRLLSWSRSGTLWLWSSRGEALAVLEGHTDEVNGALELPDGRLLSWSNDGTLRLWTSSGQPLAVLEKQPSWVLGALALADGRLLSWGGGGMLRLWSNSGQPAAVLEGHKSWIFGALVLEDGRLLSWSRGGTLRLWSSQGEALAVLEGHVDRVNGALALADGRLLSWSSDHTLRLWSNWGEGLAVLEGHTDDVFGALVLVDGRLLTWSRDRTLRLWSNQGESLAVFCGDAPITCCLYRKNDHLIVAGDTQGRVMFLQLVE